jgi:hypothetical protein
VRMFSIVWDSASIISIVTRWWPFSLIFNRRKDTRAKLGEQGGWVKPKVWGDAFSCHQGQGEVTLSP